MRVEDLPVTWGLDLGRDALGQRSKPFLKVAALLNYACNLRTAFHSVQCVSTSFLQNEVMHVVG